MNARDRLWSFTAWSVLLLCSSVQAQAEDPPSVVRVNIIHMNDIYEINPFGKNLDRGGLAQVAQYRKETARKNRNTFAVLAGDLFSPSPMGSLPPSAPWKGKQIVDVMNMVGLDLAVIGNHEFDIARDLFFKRVNESNFPWISANVTDELGKPLTNIKGTFIKEFRGMGGATVRVAFLGLTVDSNKAAWVRYSDPIETAKRELAKLKGQADLIIGLTHLDLKDDLRLAEACPEIHVILGGHEHEAFNVEQKFPNRHVARVFKADSNSATVWLHAFKIDTATRRVELESNLIPIDAKVKPDPDTAAVVKSWNEQYEKVFSQKYPDHKTTDVVNTFQFDLQGKDALTRQHQTNLGGLVARAMLGTLPKTDPRPKVAILNSGSIRIDDNIAAGIPIRIYDVQRILPFGGPIIHVQMKGALIRRLLNQSESSMKEKGGYLQYAGIKAGVGGSWKAGAADLNDGTDYLVAMSEYLFKGSESGFEYINVNGKLADGMKLEDQQPPKQNSDVQHVLLDAMKAVAPDDAEMKAAILPDAPRKCDTTASIQLRLADPSGPVSPAVSITTVAVPPVDPKITYPGVQLEEIAAGVKSIAGVGSQVEKSNQAIDRLADAVKASSKPTGEKPDEDDDCCEVWVALICVVGFLAGLALATEQMLRYQRRRQAFALELRKLKSNDEKKKECPPSASSPSL